MGGERFVNADFTQLAVAQAGEDGDGDEQRRLAVAGERVDGGFQHFAATAGVDVHHPHAHLGGDAQRGGDGVGDVVVFEVEEDVVTDALQRFDQLPPFAGVEFFADFQAAEVGRELGGKCQGVCATVVVEGD